MASLRKSQPKLKDSCDHCASAKVRCGKEKPSCNRCLEKGHNCAYSYSCRAGRHLVKGDKSTSTSGSFSLSLETAMPLFPYNASIPNIPTSTSDAVSQFGITSPESRSRHDSVTGAYACPTYFSSPQGNTLYQAMSCSFPQPDMPARTMDITPSFGSASQLQYGSRAMGLNADSVGAPRSLSLPCDPVSISTDPVHDTQWTVSDAPCLTLEPIDHTAQPQCIMIGHQNCLARLLNAFGMQRAEQSLLTDFNFSDPSSIVVASNVLNHALKVTSDPVATNKAVLNLATSTFDCSCWAHDSKLQHLLAAVALNVMARYSAIAFGDNESMTPSLSNTSPCHRARFVLDELHRVAAFLDNLDRPLQTSSRLPQQIQDFFGSAAASMESGYNMGAGPAFAATYPPRSASSSSCSSVSSARSSVSPCSSGITSPNPTQDWDFAFCVTELRRRLHALRAEIMRRVG